MSEEKLKVIIADDSPELIEGLRLLLDAYEKFEIVATVSDGNELVNCPHLHDADLILTDIEMPRVNGIEAAKQINYRYPYKRMIAITMYMDKVYLQQIIEAGFRGFVHKPRLVEELPGIIDKVLNNNFSFPDYLA